MMAPFFYHNFWGLKKPITLLGPLLRSELEERGVDCHRLMGWRISRWANRRVKFKQLFSEKESSSEKVSTRGVLFPLSCSWVVSGLLAGLFGGGGERASGLHLHINTGKSGLVLHTKTENGWTLYAQISLHIIYKNMPGPNKNVFLLIKLPNCNLVAKYSRHIDT